MLSLLSLERNIDDWLIDWFSLLPFSLKNDQLKDMWINVKDI